MIYFATLFDINYLSRGLALYESIKRHHKIFVLYITCLDDNVFNYFKKKKFPHIQLIALSEIESSYPELLAIKTLRKPVDYIFTLSPYYPSFILKKNPAIPFICSLDCDQYFFSNSEFIFKDLEKYSVLITPHRFTKELLEREIYGKYNVSFQVFKNDDTGNHCLALWRSQCLEWCKDLLEGERFADQKYLNNWQSHFGLGINSINHIGMGLAPWNVGDKKITLQNNKIYVDDHILVLYHYQGLRVVYKNLINSGLVDYDVKPSIALSRFILSKIIRAIFKVQNNNQADTIGRYEKRKYKNLFENIICYGMFYKLGNIIIGLDKVHELKLKKEKK